MRRRSPLVLLAAMLVAGCSISIEGEENPAMPVWDLRTNHRINDVGWPEDNDGSTFKVDPEPGELTILLPGEISIAGPFDVVANRPLKLDEDADRDVLQYLVVNFDEEPVSDAAARARDLVQRWGLDGTRLEEWALRNADGPDYAGSATMANTPSHPITDDGPIMSILARARDVDDAYLSVTVSWDLEGSAPG